MGSICVKKKEKVNHNTEKEPRRAVLQLTVERLENNFKLQKMIGQGAFGIVRKGVSVAEPQRSVAIKSMKRGLMSDTASLVQELEIIRSIDHPNIVKYYDYFVDQRYLHIVMEYCSGGELFDRIKLKSSLSEREAATYMEKILLAVNHLHEMNICHRDLKPQNFLFENDSEDAELKLIDFGLSNRLGTYGKKKTMKEIAGTPYYVAPEVIKQNYHKSCDLWSCGVMLYVMLNGDVPFKGRNEQELFQNILNGKIDRSKHKWKNISSTARDLILKLLNKNPKKRITASKALLHPWFQSNEDDHNVVDSAILSNISKFSVSNKMKGIALGIMVKTLEYEQIKEIREMFYDLDKSNTGYLSVEDIIQGLPGYIPEKNAKKLFQNMDFKGDGRINYSEFLAACLSSKLESNEQLLWNTFKLFDTDSSGYITRNDLRKALDKLGYRRNTVEIDDIIDEVDLGKDGKISFEEFRAAFDKYN